MNGRISGPLFLLLGVALVFLIGFASGYSYERSRVCDEYQLHPWDKSKPIIGLPRGGYRKPGPDVLVSDPSDTSK